MLDDYHRIESSSEVQEYEQPRGYRVWEGTIEIAGARLLAATPPANSYRVSVGSDTRCFFIIRAEAP